MSCVRMLIACLIILHSLVAADYLEGQPAFFYTGEPRLTELV
jgi:hypothetical protein